MNLQAMVRAFHFKFALPTNPLPYPSLERAEPMTRRVDHVQEEVDELRTGLAEGDLVKVADALADIQYLVYGLACQAGVELDDVFVAVHAANMKKVRSDDGDPKKLMITKPEGWKAPDVAGVLRDQGWPE